MSHPLRASEVPAWPVPIGALRAAVKVRHDRAREALVIQEAPIAILKPDAFVADVPARLTVLDPEGKRVKPSKGSKFLITTESFDPYHLVAEVPVGWRGR